jgi:hypothetical protein
MKGGPFPASATAEGAQFNVPPSLWERVRVRGFWSQTAGALIGASHPTRTLAPPSTGSATPVMKLASLEARNNAA